MVTPQGYERLSKLTLAVGFAMLLVGVVAAYTDPATGYELSVLTATPTLYFVGLGVALLVSVWLSFVAVESRAVRDGALLLGGLSVTSVVMLPVVRGYHLFVGGDSLTHLGWMREILSGQLEPTGLLYPGIHTITIFVSELTGIRLGLTQMHVTLAFVLAYVLFTMLCVRMLGSQRWAVPVGLFAGLLLLPNNNVSIHIQAHAVTQSLLFLPFALYLTLRYVNRDDEWMNPFNLATQNGLLLALASFALVLLHPQGALNLILILLGVTVVQFLSHRYRDTGGINGHRPVYLPTVVAVAGFLLWTPRYERVRNAVVGVVERLLFGAPPADEISQRASSLTEIGGSISVLFVKLFLVAFLFCLLAGVLSLLVGTGRLKDRFPGRNAMLSYVIVALAPLVVGFLVFFLSSSNTMHFRYVGFIMVPATILGAVAISDAADRLTDRFSPRTAGVCLVVVFLVLFPLPLATVHSTPFILRPTSDVSEMHYEGVNTTVEQMDRDVPFAGIRTGPDRLVEAAYGTQRSENMGIGGLDTESAIPSRVFDRNLTTHYDSPRYVPVDESDYQQEVVLYKELRYSDRGFAKLDASPALDRVQSNGEYRLYLLDNQTS